MSEKPPAQRGAILHSLGSLWFAAVLLVLLSLAMACATVFESMWGTDRALATFYKAWWFEVLMGLLALNVAAALAVRYPFSRRQIGFVLTHAGILIVLGGAMITNLLGIDGRVGIAEGQTVDSFSVPQPTLTLLNRTTRAHAAVDLDGSVFRGFRSVEHPKAPFLNLSEAGAEIQRYIPDSTLSEEVVDDHRGGAPAVEVSLSPSGRDNPSWVFAGRGLAVGPLTVSFRQVSDPAELNRLLQNDAAATSAQPGTVRVEHQGIVLEYPLEQCLGGPVPISDTGFAIRVLRYLPDAMVGANNQLVSRSDRPVNPAIEFELTTGPGGTVKGKAFARFPDFSSMHGEKVEKEVKVTLVAPSSTEPEAPVGVLGGADGALHVRFRAEGGKVSVREIHLGTPVETPWPGMYFTVLRRLENARMVHRVVPVDPVRETRVPAILVRVSSPSDSGSAWVQMYEPRTVTLGGTTYDLVFGDKRVSLGFKVTLDRFRIGYYPGERRPRSFESQISILDESSGRTQARVVSMNNPAKFGGYSFYQSSYRMDESRSVSYLSVARDPGLPVVFAGYGVVMIGMIVVLVTRVLGQGT